MEVIARDLRTLPPAITGAMRRLRRIDIATRDALATIKEKEEQLFEELSKAEKNRKDNKNATVDEEYYTNKMKEIVAEKTAVLAHLDDKLIYSKSLYEFLDLKIQYIDQHTAGVRHLMHTGQDDGREGASPDNVMKKKKKRKREEDFVPVNFLMYKADPNEPVYCNCRQISFGEMVGCDNPECPIEWFHFECVGLTASPETKWYCPDCRPLFQK